MAEQSSIPGWRPGTERTVSKQYSVKNLELKPTAAKAQAELYKAVWEEMDAYAAGESSGVPCVLNPEPYTSDDLPTDREAQFLCSSCPVKDLCRDYAESSHAAWGVYAGEVRGRALDKAMKEGEDD